MSMLYTQNERLFGGLHNDLSALNITMGNIQKITMEAMTNIDKNIVPITITAVSESVLLQISIDDINKAKQIIQQRDINDFKYSDLLMKHLTRLQVEKMNKYMTRRLYRRSEYVYREGEIPKLKNDYSQYKKKTYIKIDQDENSYKPNVRKNII